MVTLPGNALITGAGSGIGQALAVAYAQAGCHGVALVDVNADGLKKTAEFIKTNSPRTQTIELVVDISDPESVQAMMAEALKGFGELHYAANVAGITCKTRSKTADYDIAEFDKINSINARGLLLCVQAEIQAMRKQPLAVTEDTINPRRAQRGSIVNVGSVCGLSSIQNIMPYVTSKHAVTGITRCAALDHAREGIRINTVCPGFVETPMLQQRMEGLGHTSQTSFAGQEGIPMGRMALADEIADACIFLSSSRSSYMNGSSMVVDGGKMASFQYSAPVD